LAAKLNPSTWNRRTERTVPVSFVQTLAMARVGEVESRMLEKWRVGCWDLVVRARRRWWKRAIYAAAPGCT
jgi:hypothetical protein